MLRRNRCYSLSEDVLRRLFAWLPPADGENLRTALLWESERDVLTKHHNWLVRRSGKIPTQIWGVRVAALPLGRPADRARAREALLRKVKPQLPRLFAWFENRLKVVRAQPDSARRALAYDHVLETLLDGEDSAGVELTLDDYLSGPINERKKKLEKLRKILDYGMRRELLSLDRPPNEVRVKTVVRKGFEKEVTARAFHQYLLMHVSK
jgi:hypothetical protein